jgi:hypothetical protein
LDLHWLDCHQIDSVGLLEQRIEDIGSQYSNGGF